MIAAMDPGRAAYEARFAHARPRDVEPWDSLTPEVKAIWARVEMACRAPVTRVVQALYDAERRQVRAEKETFRLDDALAAAAFGQLAEIIPQRRAAYEEVAVAAKAREAAIVSVWDCLAALAAQDEPPANGGA